MSTHVRFSIYSTSELVITQKLKDWSFHHVCTLKTIAHSIDTASVLSEIILQGLKTKLQIPVIREQSDLCSYCLKYRLAKYKNISR